MQPVLSSSLQDRRALTSIDLQSDSGISTRGYVLTNNFDHTVVCMPRRPFIRREGHAVPVGVAANVCDVNANVLADQAKTGAASCDATSTSQALSRAIAAAIV